jgi:glycosyltransferase involved in cell wall biosynthesis
MSVKPLDSSRGIFCLCFRGHTGLMINGTNTAATDLEVSCAIDRPVRVLHVIEATLGGTLLFLDTIITATSGLPIHFGLAYSTLRATPAIHSALQKARDNGWEVFQIEMTREINFRSDLQSTWELIKLYSRFSPDIVHCHSSKAGALSRVAAVAYPFRRLRIAYAPHSVASHLGKKYLFAERALAPLTARLLPVTQSEANQLVDLKLTHPGAYTVVWPAVDCERFTVQDKEKSRLDLGLPPGRPILIGVGRLTAQKAPIAFVEIVARTIAQIPDAMGIWVGDGELREEFIRAVREAGLQDRIALVGWKNDVRPWLASADILVSTSKYESFGYMVAEARAMERPVVATDITGTCDIMNGELAQFLYPTGDSIHAAELVLKLLQEPKLASQIGRAGRAIVEERFSFSNMRQSLDAMYSRLL